MKTSAINALARTFLAEMLELENAACLHAITELMRKSDPECDLSDMNSICDFIINNTDGNKNSVSIGVTIADVQPELSILIPKGHLVAKDTCLSVRIIPDALRTTLIDMDEMDRAELIVSAIGNAIYNADDTVECCCGCDACDGCDDCEDCEDCEDTYEFDEESLVDVIKDIANKALAATACCPPEIAEELKATFNENLEKEITAFLTDSAVEATGDDEAEDAPADGVSTKAASLMDELDNVQAALNKIAENLKELRAQAGKED